MIKIWMQNDICSVKLQCDIENTRDDVFFEVNKQ